MINLSRATDTPSALTAVPPAPMSPPLLREQYLVQRPAAAALQNSVAAGLGKWRFEAVRRRKMQFNLERKNDKS